MAFSFRLQIKSTINTFQKNIRRSAAEEMQIKTLIMRQIMQKVWGHWDEIKLAIQLALLHSTISWIFCPHKCNVERVSSTLKKSESKKSKFEY